MIARFKFLAVAALGLALASGSAFALPAKTTDARPAPAVHATAKTPAKTIAKTGRGHVARARHAGKTPVASKIHGSRIAASHHGKKHLVARRFSAKHVVARHVATKRVAVNRPATPVSAKLAGKPAALRLAHRSSGKTSIVR